MITHFQVFVQQNHNWIRHDCTKNNSIFVQNATNGLRMLHEAGRQQKGWPHCCRHPSMGRFGSKAQQLDQIIFRAQTDDAVCFPAVLKQDHGIRQGPHQGAQKSTSAFPVPFLTCVSKLFPSKCTTDIRKPPHDSDSRAASAACGTPVCGRSAKILRDSQAISLLFCPLSGILSLPRM